MRPAVSGATGTLSHAVAQRSGQFDTLIEALKPRMAGQVAGLQLRSGIKNLLERVDVLAGSISFEGADEVREKSSRIVEDILKEQQGTNLIAQQPKGGNQPTHVEDAVKASIRHAMANYWRQCLRDCYVSELQSTYAPEIAAGDLRIVAGMPEDSSARLIRATWADFSKIADRSFCLVTESRTIFVTIGRQDFQIIAGKASGSAIADHEFEGGSAVKKDANLLTDAILHLPELRYFSRQVVGAHVGLPDIVRTYETYTLECSRQIETDMQDLVNGVFPLYARWKLSNPTRQYERHGNTSWHAGAMSAVDDVLKERYEKAVKSPDWAVGRGGIGSHMDIVTKSYLSWHALRAISEVNTALSTLRGELADLPRKRRFSIYSSEQEASEMRQGIVFLENVLKELSVVRAAHDQSAVAGTPAAGKGIKMPNFVQILCGDRILERLRETHMKPFFDKLQAVYDADRQIGRVQEGVVKIPSATYVKIALGQPDGTPLYTWYASVGSSGLGGHFVRMRREAERLAPGEFARLITMSMPHLVDPKKDGARSVEIDPAYSAFMDYEISLHFWRVPEDRRILPEHISRGYRLFDYHPKNDPHA